MKKLFVLLFIFSFLVSNAQKKFFYTVREYYPVEIILEDGSKLEGFLKDFTLPHLVKMVVLFDFRNTEDQLNLNQQTFNFKKTKTSPIEVLQLKDIKEITFNFEDSDPIIYQKAKLKKLDSQLNVSSEYREVLLPLIFESKINLYGIKMLQCTSGYCKMQMMIGYIKKPNEDTALRPIDFSLGSLLNVGKIDDKFFKSYEILGKDSPAFLSFITKDKKNFPYDLRKIMYDREHEKEKRMILKNIKTKSEREAKELEMDTQRFVEIYSYYIDKYSELSQNK